MKCLVALAFSLALVSAPATAQGLAQEEAQLLPSSALTGDLFGASAAISGDTVVFGAPGKVSFGPQNGSAVVFRRSAGVWTQEQVLLAPDGDEQDSFGIAVAISGDTILVGAHWHDEVGPDSGAAYVFRFNGSSWETSRTSAARSCPRGCSRRRSSSPR